MTELERLTSTMLTQWHAEGRADGGPIVVSDLLDRVLPYRLARRLLGIDISEDYEALLLRLLAGEEDLVSVLPRDAAELARTTIATKLPDLNVLQQLRSAEVTVTTATVARLEGVLQMPPPRHLEETPALDSDETDIIPLPVNRIVADAIRVALEAPPADTPAGPPPEFLTKVQFTAPAASCWSCSEALPEGRSAKFCPLCGADQRQLACKSCGGLLERHWKHCPDCGVALGG